MTNDRFSDPKHIKWAKAVKERDNFTCQICGKQNTYLHSHHLNSWDMFIKERYDVGNGTTLCFKCHLYLHLIYGKGNNTKHQFLEFKNITMLLYEIAKQNIK